MPTPLRGNLLLTAVLLLAYLLAARLGIWAAIGPNDTSAIWPPAGLALAALMLRGRRALPGLALGMFCANWFTFLGRIAGFDEGTFTGAIASRPPTSRRPPSPRACWRASPSACASILCSRRCASRSPWRSRA